MGLKITYEQTREALDRGIKRPQKSHADDSGFDIFSPIRLVLAVGQRETIALEVKFKLEGNAKFCGAFEDLGMGIEAQVRPKSGRSRDGIDVELGTIDQGYRGYVGATVTNTTEELQIIEVNDKICQIVFTPVFNGIELIAGVVDRDTPRGEGGFGSTGVK